MKDRMLKIWNITMASTFFMSTWMNGPWPENEFKLTLKG